MLVMSEDFVPYELAEKLKEKGFDYPCITHYDINKKLKVVVREPIFWHSDVLSYTDAPTISQVLKWLGEKLQIHISTKPYPCEDGLMWLYEVRKFSSVLVCVVANKTGFQEPEQAALVGIEYVLDNLI
jgi:hypothetical protein